MKINSHSSATQRLFCNNIIKESKVLLERCFFWLNRRSRGYHAFSFAANGSKSFGGFDPELNDLNKGAFSNRLLIIKTAIVGFSISEYRR